MSVIFIVLPLALLVVMAAVLAYAWAARRGQFDDLTTPAMRVLHDEPESPQGVPDQPAAPRDRGTPGSGEPL